MSEGWNIAILGATGAVGEALLETLLSVSSRWVRFTHWRVPTAQENICVSAANP